MKIGLSFGPRTAAVGWIVAVFLACGAWGIIPAGVVALLSFTFLKHQNRRVNRILKLGLLSIWIALFVLAHAVTDRMRPLSMARPKTVRLLYDINCGAPFLTARYPYSVVEVADGFSDDFDGAIFRCGK